MLPDGVKTIVDSSKVILLLGGEPKELEAVQRSVPQSPGRSFSTRCCAIRRVRSPPAGRSVWRRKVKDGDVRGIKAKTLYPTRPDAFPDDSTWLPDEVFPLIQAGLLNGKSIGFIPTQARYPTDREAERGVRRVVEQWVLLEYACSSSPASNRPSSRPSRRASPNSKAAAEPSWAAPAWPPSAPPSWRSSDRASASSPAPTGLVSPGSCRACAPARDRPVPPAAGPPTVNPLLANRL